MKKTSWLLGSLIIMSNALLAQTQLAGQVPEVPEPGTIAMMGAGLAGLGYIAWRRNRKK